MNTFTCDSNGTSIQREWTIEGPRGSVTVFHNPRIAEWDIRTGISHGFVSTERETAREAFKLARSLAGTWPKVGMGATVCHYTDRSAATIVKVSPSMKTVTVREDISMRVDENGMSEDQDYIHLPNDEGEGREWTFRLRKDGRYRETGGGATLGVGFRRKYHDFSF